MPCALRLVPRDHVEKPLVVFDDDGFSADFHQAISPMAWLPEDPERFVGAGF